MGLIEKANCISNEKDRIDLILFDSRQDTSIVTNKREGVWRQRRRQGSAHLVSCPSSGMILQRTA